jgi:hypothetical protein
MTIHWSLLVSGVLLLLFPADRLLSARVELRTFGWFQNLENSRRHRPWWWVPALWIDPLRGFFGAWLLRRALELTSVKWSLTPKPAFGVAVGIVVVSVVMQLLTRRGDRGVMLAPIGYVGGVVAALTPGAVAAIALVIAVVGLFGLRQFPAFFVFGAAAVGLLGLLFNAGTMWVSFAAGILILPIIAAFLTGSTLEVPTRDSSGGHHTPEPPHR